MKDKRNKKLEDTQDIDAATVRRLSDQAKRNNQKSPKKTGNGSKNTSQKRKSTASGETVQKKKGSVSKNAPKRKTNTSSQNTPQRTASSNRQRQNQSQQGSLQQGKYGEQAKREQNEVKKKKVNKKKRRIRIIKRLSVFILLVCIVIGGLVALLGKLWSIKTVQIEYDNSAVTVNGKIDKSKRRYSDKEILAVADTGTGKSYLFCSEEKVSENIKQGLPYITSAQVTKDFPNKLIIKVSESKGAFSYEYGSSYAITDKANKVLEITSDAENAKKNTVIKGVKISDAKAGEILVLEGDENSKNKINLYKNDVDSIIGAVTASEIKKLTQIDLTKIDDIYMIYDNRIEIHVGNKSNIGEKMKLAVKTLEEEDKNSTTQTGKLNLTVHKKAYFTPD